MNNLFEKLVKSIVNGRRNVEVFLQRDGLYRTQCCIGESVSYDKPLKTFKTLPGAIRYGDRFLNN